MKKLQDQGDDKFTHDYDYTPIMIIMMRMMMIIIMIVIIGMMINMMVMIIIDLFKFVDISEQLPMVCLTLFSETGSKQS